VARYGREAVLEQYVALAPLGNQIHGFGYGARRYFRKPLEDLSWAEAALLAALPKAPGRMNLFTPDGRRTAERRGKIILGLLRRQGVIDKTTHRIAARNLLRMPLRSRETRPRNAYHFIWRALDSAAEGDSARNLPVRTSLDPRVQQFLQGRARAAMGRYRKLGAGNVALIVASRKTGEVLGYVGSAEYGDEVNAGSIDYATVPRSVGSTLKPLLYAHGLSSGTFTPGSIVADLPIQRAGPGGTFTARNVDSTFLGPMLYRRALANSRNLPTVRVLEEVGMEAHYEFLTSFGLPDPSLAADYYGYGLVLGGIYASLSRIVEVYGTIANEGRDFRLSFRSGGEPPTSKTQLTEAAARQVAMFLSDPLARLPSYPRGGNLDLPFPVALKTGTSQGFRDAWCVGFSREHVVGVWLGHPDAHRMNHVTGVEAAGVLKRIFLFLEPDAAEGVHERPFPPPRGYVPARVDALTGKLACRHSADVSLEYFPPHRVPREVSDIYVPYPVDRRTGRPATERTPPREVETRISVQLPPRYAAWGASRGYARPTVPPEPNVALVSIESPAHGSRYIMDPDLPRRFQTVALRAEVEPAVPEIIWTVNGEELARVPYPYEARFPLSPGRYAIQARFAAAHVESSIVEVTVGSP
jgi:penicillin-binding protein 1C